MNGHPKGVFGLGRTIGPVLSMQPSMLMGPHLRVRHLSCPHRVILPTKDVLIRIPAKRSLATSVVELGDVGVLDRVLIATMRPTRVRLPREWALPSDGMVVVLLMEIRPQSTIGMPVILLFGLAKLAPTRLPTRRNSIVGPKQKQ